MDNVDLIELPYLYCLQTGNVYSTLLDKNNTGKLWVEIYYIQK